MNRKQQIIRIILYLGLVLFLKSNAFSQVVYIKYNNDKTTQKMSKKLKIFIINGNVETELIRINDSAYIKPEIEDSILLESKKIIDVKLVFENVCFETYIFNILYKYNSMEFEIHKHPFKRRYSIILRHSYYSMSPNLKICN